MVTIVTTLPLAFQRSLDRLSGCATIRDRLAMLLALGRQLPPLEESYQREDTKVAGCLSTVYLIGHLKDGCIWYQGTADALLIKGLMAVLFEGLGGLPAAEILQLAPDSLRALGLGQSLVPGRSNALFHLLQSMKDEAARLQHANDCDTTSTTQC